MDLSRDPKAIPQGDIEYLLIAIFYFYSIEGWIGTNLTLCPPPPNANQEQGFQTCYISCLYDPDCMGFQWSTCIKWTWDYIQQCQIPPDENFAEPVDIFLKTSTCKNLTPIQLKLKTCLFLFRYSF